MSSLPARTWRTAVRLLPVPLWPAARAQHWSPASSSADYAAIDSAQPGATRRRRSERRIRVRQSHKNGVKKRGPSRLGRRGLRTETRPAESAAAAVGARAVYRWEGKEKAAGRPRAVWRWEGTEEAAVRPRARWHAGPLAHRRARRRRRRPCWPGAPGNGRGEMEGGQWGGARRERRLAPPPAQCR